jgi:hypothetical protein
MLLECATDLDQDALRHQIERTDAFESRPHSLCNIGDARADKPNGFSRVDLPGCHRVETACNDGFAAAIGRDADRGLSLGDDIEQIPAGDDELVEL